MEILRHALAVDKNIEYVKPMHKKEKKKKKEKPVEDPFEGKSLEECYKELLEMKVGCLKILKKFKKLFLNLSKILF